MRSEDGKWEVEAVRELHSVQDANALFVGKRVVETTKDMMHGADDTTALWFDDNTGFAVLVWEGYNYSEYTQADGYAQTWLVARSPV